MSIFLGSKKKDLIDKTRNGEGSKKHREKSDSSQSVLDSSVFSDGFHSPEFAKILVNCLKSIELQVKELFVLYQETKHSESKG